MNNLLGQHNDVVGAIMARLEAIQADDDGLARVLVLTGESGIGKSRIVREVYGKLQSRQPKPTYWPPLLASTLSANSLNTDPLEVRKVLGPDPVSFEWKPGAVPTFGWWHFECDMLESGNAVNVVGAAYPQLQAHLPALGIAWNNKAGRLDKMQRTQEKVIEEVRTAITEGGLEGLDAVGLVFPGMGTLIRWAGQVGSKIASERHLRRQLASSVTLASEAHVSVAEELAEAIRSTALPGLPQVVVIEDMHRMGDDLAELVTRLSKPDKARPVLVIGTVWPEGFTNPRYQSWFVDAVAEGRVEPLTVHHLKQSDLVMLLRQYAPNTDDGTAARVVERMPNPYFLKLWLMTRSTQRRIASNGQALLLDEGELKDLPLEVMDVLRQRWREFPESVQEALIIAVAARSGESDPGSINPVSRFLPDVVSEASKRTGLSDGDLEAGLEAAVHPGAWCNTDSNSQWLRERDLQDLVMGYVKNSRLSLGAGEHHALRVATRDVLVEWIDKRRDEIELSLDPAVLVAAEWLVSLPPAGAGEWEEADVAAHWALAEAAAWNYDYDTAIRKARIILDQAGKDNSLRNAVREGLAYWLGESGRPGEAVRLYRELLRDQRWILCSDDTAILNIRHHLALRLFYMGQEAEALALEEQVLADRRRILGPEHPDTLTAQNNVASWLGLAGRLSEAIEQLEAVVAIESRLFGSDHRSTLKTRHNLATYRIASGEVVDGLEELKAVLEDQTRVLGVDDEDTLSSRHSLATSQEKSGNLTAGIEQLELLIQDELRVLGATHPSTLITRSNFAKALGDVGRVDEAIEQFHEILKREKSIGLESNSRILITRANLAHAFYQAGRVVDAVDHSAALVEECTRILGKQHRRTVNNMHLLGSYLAVLGHFDESIAHLRTVLMERTRVLGERHADTVQTQNNLDYALTMKQRAERREKLSRGTHRQS